MAIEVRQLVVKSNLVQRSSEVDSEQRSAQPNLETLRQSVLAECRELIAQAQRETRER